MEPFRFADFLFIFLTLVITCTILWFVNKAKAKGARGNSTESSRPETEVISDSDENKE